MKPSIPLEGTKREMEYRGLLHKKELQNLTLVFLFLKVTLSLR